MAGSIKEARKTLTGQLQNPLLLAEKQGWLWYRADSALLGKHHRILAYT